MPGASLPESGLAFHGRSHEPCDENHQRNPRALQSQFSRQSFDRVRSVGVHLGMALLAGPARGLKDLLRRLKFDH